MADNLWIRKNNHGKPRLGILPMAIIAVGLGGLMFYVTFRYTSTDKTRAVRNNPVQSDVAAVTENPTQFKPIVVKDQQTQTTSRVRPNENREERVSTRPQQNVLDITGLSLGEFAAQESMESRPVIEEDLSAFSTVFRQNTGVATGTVQIQKADNGAEYLKSRTGIYTAFADAGTQLTGPKGEIYEIGSDSLLYRLETNGKVKEDKIVTGNFKDQTGRVYRITRSGQLRLITPGTVGKFTGPDNVSYKILADGNIEEVLATGSRVVSVISGEGEFVGSDNQRYAVYNGILFKPTAQAVSFGADRISSTGIFLDPAGKMKVLGEDGLVYQKNTAGKLEVSNIEGTGEFRGPDGGIYRIDDGGSVGKISSGITDTNMVKSGVVSNTVNTEEVPAAQSSTVTGVSRASENFIVTGDENDQVQKLKQKLKPKMVYLAPEVKPDAARKLNAKNLKGLIIPKGQKIPFYTLSEINTQFGDSGGIIEAVVAENVYFNQAKIPAGSRLYGTYKGIGTHNRLSLTFDTLLLTSGEQLALTGFVFDASMKPGIEAYYEPTAPFVIATRYANAAVLVKVSELQPKDQDNRPVGDISYLEDSIKKTQEELEVQYGSYHWLPAGTAGIFMLDATVVIDDRKSGVDSVDEYNDEVRKANGEVIINKPKTKKVTDQFEKEEAAQQAPIYPSNLGSKSDTVLGRARPTE